MKNIYTLFITCLLLLGSSSGLAATYVVTNTNDDGIGSLRQAITDANATGTADSVVFDIPGAGPHIINIGSTTTSSLPDCSSGGGVIIIDGTTQPLNGSTAIGPQVILDGTNVTTGNMDGILLRGDGSEVYGLYIQNFPDHGLSVAADNVIVGKPGYGNVLSGNNQKGLYIYIVSLNGTFQSNLIGVEPDSVTAQGNADDGVHFWQSADNHLLGGPTVAEGNIIAYNDVGVYVRSGDFNRITHNSIFCNTNEGIKLDAFSTGNGLYTAPVISTGTPTTLTGTAAANDIIEIFGSHTCGPDCEGKTFIGETTADGAGNWTYTGTLGGDVTATAANASNDNTSEFSACFYIAPAPVADFSTSTTSACNSLCTDFTDLSSENPTSWLWSFPGGTPSTSTDQNPLNICYSTAGDYTVTLEATNADGTGTTTFTDYITVFASPTVDLGNDTLICSTCNLDLDAGNAGSTYLWSTAETTQTINVTAPGQYYVDVTDANGCMSSDTINVTNDLGVGIGNENGFKLFPNPANNNVTVVVSQGTYLFSIYDISGKLILSTELGLTKNVLSLADIDAGIYTFLLRDMNTSQSEQGKIIIRH